MVSMDNRLLKKKETSLRGAELKLFVRDVRDRQRRKRPITVRSWSTVKDIKDTIQQAIHIPASSQQLFFGPLLTSGKELPNHRSLHDAGIYRSGETILLHIKNSNEGSPQASDSFSLNHETKPDVCISTSMIDASSKPLRQLVQRARRALALGFKPEFILEGSGGTYFLHDARKIKIAVFKPADEEPYAQNNPRGYLQPAGENMFLREGVVPGEACIREVAAFMMDHGGFSTVPMTTLVEARHPAFNTNGSRLKVSEGGAAIGSHSLSRGARSTPALVKKVGSFQEFVRTECSMDDMSPSMISVDEVHKIAILDIRLMNADRNSANLLCRRRQDNSIQLIPIDHGFCLRSVADVSWMDWCWLDWPQMKEPMSEKTKEYILNLNVEDDARLLKDRLNLCQEALDIFCASSSILKAGARAGLSLYEIAVMCCRNDNLGEAPSTLEMLFSMASELAESAVRNGRFHHAAASRALQDQLPPMGGSLLSPMLEVNGFHKAASAVNLSHFTQGLAALSVEQKSDRLPGMIQSSASDSSSDNGDAVDIDADERKEWAANVIADVSMDRSMSYIATKPRSLSIESESSHGSVGGKFWFTKPGSPSDSSVDSDDESISWTPNNSPPQSSFFETAARGLKQSYNPYSARRQSLTVAPSDDDDLLHTMKTPVRVTFAEELLFGKEKKQQPLGAKFKHSNSDVAVPSKSENKLRRSQSYSAMPSTLSEQATDDESAQRVRPVDREEYRDYFLKFVELVIVRETTAASQILKST